MAVPKRRKSKSRARTQRAHKNVAKPHVVYCANCGGATLPHRVCPGCGYYNDRDIEQREDT